MKKAKGKIELENVNKHNNPEETLSKPRAKTEEGNNGRKRLHSNEKGGEAAEEKQRKEKWVDKMTESGLERVKLVKPNMLKGQATNSLEKAMEYSFNLRQRAKNSSLDEAELKAIGNSMEEYAFHLIEPLKNDIIKRAIFEGKDFDRIAEKAVLLKQKKFLAHPVVYDLLRRRWAGSFYYWQNSTLFEKDCFKWIFLNLWTLFDVLLFPVFYIVLYLIYKIKVLKTSRRGSYRRHAFVMYHKYFTTPYFIFLRDTLSYFVLLGLHFVICIQPATLEFTAVEWVIVFFFLGRFMMEVYQAAIGLENEKEIIEDDVTKRLREKLSRMLYKYLSDQWNVLDAITLIVYVVLLILRAVAWSAHSSVLNNRLLAVAGYLYGLNSMLLTLRLFGHIMELKKSTGTIQIALFQIIGAVLAVFGQFLAVLVAFSLAITKIRMTEVSFTGNTTTSSIQGSCFNDQGQISCWWKIARHLIWSLLVEPELLQSLDDTSNALTQILYGLFLIMAVVMLMNMMIALLTNTYQQVEDNAFYEWSYKKAATIKTYCNYHPVPVPFNVISLTFILLRYFYKKMCCTKCPAANADSDTEKERRRYRALEKTSFNQLIADLESEYYSVHGDEFPITGDRLDHVVKQTEENHQLVGHIAERLFTYGYSNSQGVGSDSNQEWDTRGISVLGNRLSYTSCNCLRCNNEYQDHHGARYRVPLSPEMPGFEILIEEGCSTNHDIVLGVVTQDFDLHKVPGMEGNTVGYLVEKEIIYDVNTQRKNCWPKILTEMADRGDLLGCEILYGRKTNNCLPVLFTLNGRIIGEGTIEINNSTADQNQEGLYAYVGIGSQENSVRFKHRYKHVPQERQGMDHSIILLKQIMDQLNELNKNYCDIKKEMDTLRKEIQTKSENEVSAL